MTRKYRVRLVDFWLFVYLFMLVYTPPLFALINININKYFLLILITMPIFIYYLVLKTNRLKAIILNKNNYKLILGIFISSIYIFIIASLRGYETRFIQNMFFIYQFLNILILIDILKRRKYTYKKMIHLFFNIVLLQSLICILMLLVPSLREIALKLYYNGGVENIFISKMRIYGLSSDYTYATPIFHGFVAVVMMLFAIEYHWKYILYIPFVIIAIMLNGRTGIIIFLVGLSLIIFSYLRKTNKIIKVLFYAFVLLFVGILGFTFLEKLAPSTYTWIINGIKEITGFLLDGEKNGTIAALDNAFYFPKGIYFYIGEGHRVYRQSGYVHSDIGYVNDMFLGGVIYIVVLYLSVFKYSSVKINNKFNIQLHNINKIFSIIVISTLLIANYKGECMREGIILTGVFFIKSVFLGAERVGKR